MYVDTWHTVTNHRLPNPPETLYRVGHSGNRSNVFSSRGAPHFEGHYDFVHMKKLHANWRNREPTPFLSTFVHYSHAYNWAAQRKRTKGDHSVRIHEIMTDGLLVFGAGGGEFLVLDETPTATSSRRTPCKTMTRTTSPATTTTTSSGARKKMGLTLMAVMDPPATLYRVEHSGNRNDVCGSRATPPEFQQPNDFVDMKNTVECNEGIIVRWRNH